MSEPRIQTPCHPIGREQAISDLIESVALEETALAHIINAEGEKIQKAIDCATCCQELIDVNDSVNSTIKNVIKLQMLLQFKLEEAAGLDEQE